MFQICINCSAAKAKDHIPEMVFKVIDRLKDNTCMYLYVDKMILEMIRKRSVDWQVSLAWIARKPLTDLWFWEFSNLTAWILDWSTLVEKGCYTLEAWGSLEGCEKHFEQSWFVSGLPKKAQPLVRQGWPSKLTVLNP